MRVFHTRKKGVKMKTMEQQTQAVALAMANIEKFNQSYKGQMGPKCSTGDISKKHGVYFSKFAVLPLIEAGLIECKLEEADPNQSFYLACRATTKFYNDYIAPLLVNSSSQLQHMCWENKVDEHFSKR